MRVDSSTGIRDRPFVSRNKLHNKLRNKPVASAMMPSRDLATATSLLRLE